MLINVKMPTSVGILTFISRIDTRLTHMKICCFFQHKNFYKQLKLHAQLILACSFFHNICAFV